MELPRACPHCNKITQISMRWVQATPTNLYLGDDKELRHVLFSCSVCQTIFKAIYEMKSFHELVEKETALDKCSKCNQSTYHSGEYPCVECERPTFWDVEEKDPPK